MSLVIYLARLAITNPNDQAQGLNGLVTFKCGQLFESSLLAEIEHISVESAFFNRIQFRSMIRSEQFIDAQFCPPESVQWSFFFGEKENV